DVGELHRVAEFERPVLRFFAAGDHAEERRLAGAVRTDDADDRAAWNAAREFVDQQSIAVRLRQAVDVDDLLAKPRSRRDVEFRSLIARLHLLRHQFFEAGEARLALRLATLRIRAHPFELGLDRPLPRLFLLGLRRQPLVLGVEPSAVVAFERNAAAAV